MRALVRGLTVLRLLNEQPLATVAQLVVLSGYPKSAVVRILNTLREEGFVDLGDSGAGYRVLPKVQLLASALAIRNPAYDASQKLLADFAQVVKWPAEFLVPDGVAMVIRASNREVSPITLKRFEQTRFPLHNSAAGFAFLAMLDGADRERRLRGVIASGVEDEQTIRVRLDEAIQAHRRLGYSMRDYDTPIEGTRAVAVPVLAGGTPVGGLALILLRDAVSDEQLNTTLLPRLNEAAERIGESWETYQSRAPAAP